MAAVGDWVGAESGRRGDAPDCHAARYRRHVAGVRHLS
jgi:hypothetical protein